MVNTFALSTPVEGKPLTEWRSIAVELLGAQTRFVQGERWRHRVIECGDDSGVPLILLHGIGGSAEAFARNLRNLAEHGFRAFAADLLHHGFTDKEPYSDEDRIDLQVDALADLVGALGLDRVNIEGESLGAVIAFEFGMRYPEMCGKLVLNTGFGLVALRKTDFVTNTEGKDLARLKELSTKTITEPTFDTVRERMEWLMATPDRVTSELVDLRLRLYSFPEVRASMERIYFIGRDWTPPVPRWTEEDVQHLEPETLVFWTDHNPAQGPDYGEYVAGLVPGQRFYLMRDCGHWPQWEKPEEHDQVLIEFILGPQS